MRLPCFQGFLPGELVDIGEHKYLTSLVILNNGRQEAVGILGKSEFYHDRLFYWRCLWLMERTGLRVSWRTAAPRPSNQKFQLLITSL